VQHEYTVAVIDIDREAGEHLASRFPSSVFFQHGDIASKETLELFTREVKQRYPQLHLLVNNAIPLIKGIRSRCSYEDFEYAQRVGVTAPYFLSSSFADCFAEGSSIINISSSRHIQSQPDTESYSAAKGGIAALTHALAASLGPRVRVNSISPGWIDISAYHRGKTPASFSSGDKAQQPVGRVGQPPDIAQLVLFLAGEQAGFITGQDIVVDGGMTKLMIYHNDHGWTFTPHD
jgi:NAD(P)-dependent dehydrogenase (short-subunit alcohol dehydrogenase family)